MFDRLRDAVLYASAGGSFETGILYDYDALDRRIRRLQPSAGSEEVYFHDGWDIDSLEQRNWNTGQTTRRAWFTLAGTDEPLTLTEWNAATGGPSAVSYYYSTDHLGRALIVAPSCAA